MKWAITEKCHRYLLGGHFTVITDNNPLTYFCSAKLGALEQRWTAQFWNQVPTGQSQSCWCTFPHAIWFSSRIPSDGSAASVHDTWCKQSAVDSSPCVDVSGDTNSSVQPVDKAEEKDKAATTESSQVVHSQPAWTTKYKHWIQSFVLSLQHG